MKYRIHYANGKTEEVESEDTIDQFMAQAKPILAVIQLGEMPLEFTPEEAPATKPKRKAKAE